MPDAVEDADEQQPIVLLVVAELSDGQLGRAERAGGERDQRPRSREAGDRADRERQLRTDAGY
jgi:hypothetical protein